jgi:hypothetical protein
MKVSKNSGTVFWLSNKKVIRLSLKDLITTSWYQEYYLREHKYHNGLILVSNFTGGEK